MEDIAQAVVEAPPVIEQDKENNLKRPSSGCILGSYQYAIATAKRGTNDVRNGRRFTSSRRSFTDDSRIVLGQEKIGDAVL